jgi:CheY-like chemotaxis protein
MHVVIVAEDEPMIRMAVVHLLIDEGFQVWEAAHAAEAIAILKTEADGVHVLFTDVRMPGDMDGIALSHHVREHWPWIGLLVTSAHATFTEDDLPKGARFLPKPYPHNDVVKRVRELAEAT